MATGTVKRFNGQKGYGFIQPDGGGKDVFGHISALEKVGQRSPQRLHRLSDVVEIDAERCGQFLEGLDRPRSQSGKYRRPPGRWLRPAP